MPRLFTGFEIPQDIGQALAVCRGGLQGARWIDPEFYHITLRFIGDIDDHMAQDVHAVLRQARERPPFTITIEGLDTFGGGKPRALFARVTASPEILDCQSEQERLMRRIGLAPEARKFTPHVTLARMRDVSPLDVADYLTMHGHFPRLTFTAKRVALFSARKSVGGGPYIVEAVYPLA